MDKPEGNREFSVIAVTETQLLAAMVLLGGLGVAGTIKLLAMLAANMETQPSMEAQQKAADEAKAAIERAAKA